MEIYLNRSIQAQFNMTCMHKRMFFMRLSCKSLNESVTKQELVIALPPKALKNKLYKIMSKLVLVGSKYVLPTLPFAIYEGLVYIDTCGRVSPTPHKDIVLG